MVRSKDPFNRDGSGKRQMKGIPPPIVSLDSLVRSDRGFGSRIKRQTVNLLDVAQYKCNSPAGSSRAGHEDPHRDHADRCGLALRVERGEATWDVMAL